MSFLKKRKAKQQVEQLPQKLVVNSPYLPYVKKHISRSAPLRSTPKQEKIVELHLPPPMLKKDLSLVT